MGFTLMLQPSSNLIAFYGYNFDFAFATNGIYIIVTTILESYSFFMVITLILPLQQALVVESSLQKIWV